MAVENKVFRFLAGDIVAETVGTNGKAVVATGGGVVVGIDGESIAQADGRMQASEHDASQDDAEVGEAGAHVSMPSNLSSKSACSQDRRMR